MKVKEEARQVSGVSTPGRWSSLYKSLERVHGMFYILYVLLAVSSYDFILIITITFNYFYALKTLSYPNVMSPTLAASLWLVCLFVL